MAMTREQQLASAVLAMAESLTEQPDVLDLMQLLVDRAVAVVDVDVAALMLHDQRGHLQLVASSTHDPDVVRVLGLAGAEGPCVECLESGEAVTDAAAEESVRRSPGLGSGLAAVGLGTVHALPLRTRTLVVGSLGLFSAGPAVLGPERRTIGEALAQVAVVGLLQERTERQAEILAAQLQSALHERVLVEQAKGVVAELLGVSIDGAFAWLREWSTDTRAPLAEVARLVLERALDPRDPGPAAPGL